MPERCTEYAGGPAALFEFYSFREEMQKPNEPPPTHSVGPTAPEQDRDYCFIGWNRSYQSVMDQALITDRFFLPLLHVTTRKSPLDVTWLF